MSNRSNNPVLSARLVIEPNKVIAEVNAILRTVDLADGGVRRAAERLGISDRTLYRWIEQYPTMLNGTEGLNADPWHHRTRPGGRKKKP